ncbi:hypothetical protein RclHR1_01040036 [Rhizophagus clarus]|uniref:Uncharacterized protein n=1 Tax=Rhizophagus clarus TaxID=94130 RepID=A0A2Z6QG16_9GLOM|nr:hypothetical protein RclHR1_01040036 [Rhizophagus clarus]
MKLDSRNYCQTNTMNWTLELRVPDEYYEPDLGIEVSGEGEGFQTNNTNWTLEFRVPDKYYEPDFRIEVSFWMNNTNWTLEFRFPDEYYKLDFGIEDESGPTQDSVRGGPRGCQNQNLEYLEYF